MGYGESFFKQPVTRDDAYMAWVRTLACCGCGFWGKVEAHHCIADRHGSAKASDLHTMPLCQPCHRELHAGWVRWEAKHGSQWLFVARTMETAASLGILKVDRKRAAQEC